MILLCFHNLKNLRFFCSSFFPVFRIPMYRNAIIFVLFLIVHLHRKQDTLLLWSFVVYAVDCCYLSGVSSGNKPNIVAQQLFVFCCESCL